MAENKKDKLNETGVDTTEVIEDINDNADVEEAMKSFLERDTSDVTDKEKTSKPRKISKNLLWVIIGCVVVVVIIGIVILLKTVPVKEEKTEIDYGADASATVDEAGEHQINLNLNKKGELENNSYGTLIEYTPSQIKQIDVENESGSFTVIAHTPTTKDKETGEEKTDATKYTLVGYEDMALQAGVADAIADDVAAINFSSVADVSGQKSKDFGFEKPRATVKTLFTDKTTSTIIVGGEAPNGEGTYIKFGDCESVFVIENEAADSFLYSVLDLVDLNINTAASTTDNNEFQSLKLSGTNFKDTIELRPNDDEAIDSTYVMISPKKMFISEVESANFTGGIRGLFAEEAVCVNPSDAQLSEYGLKNPYAVLSAVYPDTSVNLKTSAPKNDSVYIIGDSNIIYKIGVASVPWISTSVDKLTPDVVIDPNFNSLTKIVVKDSSGSYAFDVVNATETVTNTDGETEEVQTTTCTYKDKRLDSDNFQVFYQNICNMKNAGKAEGSAKGGKVLTIELSYSTSRPTDVIEVYSTGNTKYVADLNGETLCLVYKSYCTKFSKSVQDLIKGKTVSSF